MKTLTFIGRKNTVCYLHCKIFQHILSQSTKKLVEWHPLTQQVALNSSLLQFLRDLKAENFKLKSKHVITKYMQKRSCSFGVFYWLPSANISRYHSQFGPLANFCNYNWNPFDQDLFEKSLLQAFRQQVVQQPDVSLPRTLYVRPCLKEPTLEDTHNT